MVKPFSLFVGLRFTLARKNNLLLSFVSLISMLGISLGVLILIVALAVINGSIATLRGEALKSVPHVTVSGSNLQDDWQSLLPVLNTAPGVQSSAPFMEGDALLRYQGQDEFVRLRGIDPMAEAEVMDAADPRFGTLLQQLAATDNGIILGARLAGNLRLYGSGNVSATALHSLLARRVEDALGLQVVGFADFGMYGNANLALVNLASAETLWEGQSSPRTQLRLRVADVYQAGEIANAALAQARPGQDYQIVPWNVAQASLFDALNMEKILTGFMLLMIVIIGAVNIISTLVMVVADKSADIAILRTMGASRNGIMAIFMVQGLLAGLFGTAIGAVLGVMLASNVASVSLVIERAINAMISNGNIYLLSHLQTQINWGEVGLVCLAALTISFIATLYPAYRASRIQPAEVLRYE